MTLITLEQEITRQEELLNTSREELARLLNEIKALRDELERGALPGSKDCPDIKRLTTLVGTCIDTETRLGKCKELQVGIVQCGFAFDLEAARDTIGGKLDKLRAACCTEDLSGQS